MQKFDFFQHHKNVLIKNVQVYQKQSPFEQEDRNWVFLIALQYTMLTTIVD